MTKRVELAEKLFKEGYNCSQSIFAAYSDLYGIDKDTALKLSTSFGGGVGRMREICGAVSGMCMIAGLETGTAKKMDDDGKKYNYDVVQKLSGEFKIRNESIICRELLGLEKEEGKDTTPQKRTDLYYNTRPCDQLVKDAAEIIERVLYAITFEKVVNEEQIRDVASLAEEIWHEHYETIIGKDQVNYMIDKFQSVRAMNKQINEEGYQYYMISSLGGNVGYIAIREDNDSLFLSKLYIAKKYRGRGYARKFLEYIQQICEDMQLGKIRLTVNRYNEASINIYENLGFVKIGTQVADIGQGYVMDDYIMEKSLQI
ncbi:MAG: GCAxxG family protein [Herbinix sp.]|jgi:C_GCAxxG_C_C family probable redox protein|nr:GCAxxG family protein [Herbinix sp.]